MNDRLSDNLRVGADAAQVDVWACWARGMEDRIADLQRECQRQQQLITLNAETYDNLTARAKRAEREAARLQVEWTRADGLREDNRRIASTLQDQNEALQRKLEAAVERADSLSVSNDLWAKRAMAAEAALEKVRAALSGRGHSDGLVERALAELLAWNATTEGRRG